VNFKKILLVAILLFAGVAQGKLIAHYRMNDNAASTTVVSGTGTHNGTFKDVGGNADTDAHDVAGKTWTALTFDGTDDHIEIADHADFTFGDGTNDSPFSISVWIYADSIEDFRIIRKLDVVDPSTYEWVFMTTSSKVTFILFTDEFNSEGRSYNTALSTGKWYHLAGTYDGSGGITAHDGMKIYVNAVRKDDIDSNIVGTYVAMDDFAAPVWIGRISDDYADGNIDNVMLFDTELTQNEIDILYNGGGGTENPADLDDRIRPRRWGGSKFPLRRRYEY